MRPEFSIVFPVRQATTNIVSKLHRLLDLLPNLTNRFEVIVVNDSNESLEEISDSFSKTFPQVIFRNHSQSYGILSAIRTGCLMARAKRVYVQEPELDINSAEIKRFWHSKTPNNLFDLSKRKPIQPVGDELINRLANWCEALKKEKHERIAAQSARSSDNKRIDQADQGTVFPNILSLNADLSSRESSHLNDD
jgi:glycosyltransferase involved in cell wall biosynthesis